MSYLTQYTLTLFLMVIIVVIATIIEYYRKRANKHRNEERIGGEYGREPPSPRKLPIIGHLHLLSGYQVPYQAFNDLSKKYGKIIKLQLGTIKCVVVNGQKNIREVLVTKGHHFDSRPNFERYQQLFCGNKENSLAFCDWSNTQKIRRDMLKAYTFPRAFTNKFNDLENLIVTGVDEILSRINDDIVDLKPIILRSCANIFTNHFCTKSFDLNDPKFVRIVDNYDTIFYEVNQGYAADFLPFLMPFHRKNLRYINNLTHEIREFVLDSIIGDRYDAYNTDQEPNDYVDSLIRYSKSNVDDLSWDAALFALEDIIGGHSAVGNFLIKLFAYLAQQPQVQANIQHEIDTNLNGKSVRISDRTRLPYTEATIFEAIRLIASPIVPRVANRTSTIDGYVIEQGSVIFLNNYDLSMSKELWTTPDQFQPERFIRDNCLIKPEHFLPFGGGRRSCMGYKMVQLVSFGILGGLLQNYNILPVTNCNYVVPVGSLALPKDTFKFKFVRR